MANDDHAQAQAFKSFVAELSRERDDALRELEKLRPLRDGFAHEAQGWLDGLRVLDGDIRINTIDGCLVGKFPPGIGSWTRLERNTDERDRMLSIIASLPSSEDGSRNIPVCANTKHGLLCQAGTLGGTVEAPEAASYSFHATRAWAEEYYGGSCTLADVADYADIGVRSHGRNRLSERDVLVLRAALESTGRFTSTDGWHYRLKQGAPKQALLSHGAKTAAVWFRDCLETVGDVAEASTASDLRASYAAFASLPAPRSLSGQLRCESLSINGRRVWRRDSGDGWVYLSLKSSTRNGTQNPERAGCR